MIPISYHREADRNLIHMALWGEETHAGCGLELAALQAGRGCDFHMGDGGTFCKECEKALGPGMFVEYATVGPMLEVWAASHPSSGE